MVEHVAGAAPERGGDGFRLYAEIYALRLRFEQQQIETLERLGAADDVPVVPLTEVTEPAPSVRRSWLRPWR